PYPYLELQWKSAAEESQEQANLSRSAYISALAQQLPRVASVMMHSSAASTSGVEPRKSMSNSLLVLLSAELLSLYSKYRTMKSGRSPSGEANWTKPHFAMSELGSAGDSAGACSVVSSTSAGSSWLSNRDDTNKIPS